MGYTLLPISSTTASIGYTLLPTAPSSSPTPSGGSNLVSKLSAGETISALRVVRGSPTGAIFNCDSATITLSDRPIGITLTSGNISDIIDVCTSGEMTDGSWNWDTTKPIFCGSNGILTQTPIVSGFSQIVATPISPTTIDVKIELGIKRA